MVYFRGAFKMTKSMLMMFGSCPLREGLRNQVRFLRNQRHYPFVTRLALISLPGRHVFLRVYFIRQSQMK